MVTLTKISLTLIISAAALNTQHIMAQHNIKQAAGRVTGGPWGIRPEIRRD